MFNLLLLVLVISGWLFKVCNLVLVVIIIILLWLIVWISVGFNCWFFLLNIWFWLLIKVIINLVVLFLVSLSNCWVVKFCVMSFWLVIKLIFNKVFLRFIFFIIVVMVELLFIIYK